MAIALPAFNRTISSIWYTRISSILFIYTGALSLNVLYIHSIGSGIGIYSGLFHISVISQLFDLFLSIIGSLILVSWPLITKRLVGENLKKEIISNLISINNYPTKYSVIVLISTLGSTLLISSSDLISIYLSIELQSFGVYILASLYRNSESAISAGLKYFLLGALSSCFILLGCAIIYTFVGLTQLESIYSLVSSSDQISITLGFTLGVILMFIGFLFKIGAAPLHNWAPDVYDNSPTIVTIWLTIMPKISILLLLLELQSQLGILNSLVSLPLSLQFTSIENFNISESTSYILTNLLLISSLISLLIGTIVGLSQIKLKRLFAYSTISHVGFMLLALAINSEQSTESLLFYIIQYSITNLNSFLIIIALGLIIYSQINTEKMNIEEAKGSENDIMNISELKGQFFTNPLLSLSLAISLFSMAGIPPLIGFFSKQFVLYSAIQSGYYFMAIVAIIVSVISASYYLKVIKVLHTEDTEINSSELSNGSDSDIKVQLIEDPDYNIIGSYHSFLISTLTLSILLFVLKPSILLNSTTLLSLSLYQF